MKKRTKISLRTKIYLTIAGLFALTGALYAATPIFFNAFPQATGVAASTSNFYATGWCDNNFYGLDCLGNRSVLASIPLGDSPCIEKYLRIAPVQSAAAGFTPKDVFITEGQYIYKYDFLLGTISPAPFAQVGCPFSNHSSLTFDKVGTFGFKMIVACENGPIWTVDGTGNVTFVASTTTMNPPLLTHPEGPAIPPLSFGPLGGQILVGDENLHQVTAIKNDGTVTYNAFNWAPGFEALPENVNVIPSPACGFGCIANQPQGSFFQAIEDYGFFLYYGPLDFQGLGGNVLVTNEAEPPATTAGTLLVTYNPVSNAYDTTVFDPIFNFTINEGAQFVECDAVTPTPTPTPTCNFNADTYGDVYAYSYGNVYADAYGNVYTNTYGNVYTRRRNGYVYANTDAHSDTDTTGTRESDHADRNDLFTVRERHGRDPPQPELQRQRREDQENVTPGVFFYWVTVTAPAGNNSFTITQTITTGNFTGKFDFAEREQCV